MPPGSFAAKEVICAAHPRQDLPSCDTAKDAISATVGGRSSSCKCVQILKQMPCGLLLDAMLFP